METRLDRDDLSQESTAIGIGIFYFKPLVNYQVKNVFSGNLSILKTICNRKAV